MKHALFLYDAPKRMSPRTSPPILGLSSTCALAALACTGRRFETMIVRPLPSCFPIIFVKVESWRGKVERITPSDGIQYALHLPPCAHVLANQARACHIASERFEPRGPWSVMGSRLCPKSSGMRRCSVTGVFVVAGFSEAKRPATRVPVKAAAWRRSWIAKAPLPPKSGIGWSLPW